jgi:hypothetical protein
MPNWKRLIVSGSDAALNSLTVTNGITGSLLGTSSFATSASFITSLNTNAFVQGGNSFGSTAVLGTNDDRSLIFETSGSSRIVINNTGNVGIGTDTPNARLDVSGSAIISGSLSVGTSSLGPSENTLTLGARDTAGEGGQLGFNASGGTYNSASFIDNYQNRLRILRGTNTGSDTEFVNVNLHNGQATLNRYTGSGAFPGTAAATLAVDSSGNIITITGGGGATSPGGSNTQIQYNNAGAFGGVSTLTFDGTTLRATGSFTGSLVGALTGTASFATSASFASTASFVSNAFTQNGNSFGAQALLGTNDTQNLAFETNNAIRMFISSSGRIGVNTTSPREQFEVNGPILSRSGDPLFVMQDTTNADNNALYVGAFWENAFPISYGTFAINRNPSNGVHFNTARASAQINLESSSSYGVIRFYSTNTNNTTPNLTLTATPLSNIIVGGAAVGNEASARLHVRGSGGTISTQALLVENASSFQLLSIRDNGNTAFNTSNLFISGSGEIGIGKTALNARLDVSGSAIISGSFTVAPSNNIELQVLTTGTRLGNVITDAHTVTGSFGVSGSLSVSGSGNFRSSLTVDSTVNINNQTGGVPAAFNSSAGIVTNYWGVADGDFLSTPTIWLKLTLDGSIYYIPSYQ